MSDILERLRSRGITPSAQRVAIAEYVLTTNEHPSADRVFTVVGERLPVLSRATVYNTLKLFVEKGLLRTVNLAEGGVVFDSNLDRHHHFVDVDSGEIVDIDWNRLRVAGVPDLEGYEVEHYEVVLRGRRR
ncbi:MAG: Fur family transcriptional regulator [Sandaracinaceae bacterium]